MAARPKSVRIRDVAAAAGVDASVVSRVLSGDDRLSVKPETRQRVLDAVERLQYRPNRAARTLRTATTMALGIVVPDLANATYAEISRGAEAESARHGYILLIVMGSLFERLRLLEGRVDGLLYAIATSETLDRERIPEGPPSLLVNRHEPGMGPSVTVDDAGAARDGDRLPRRPRPSGHRPHLRAAAHRHRAASRGRLQLRAQRPGNRRSRPVDRGVLVRRGGRLPRRHRAADHTIRAPRRSSSPIRAPPSGRSRPPTRSASRSRAISRSSASTRSRSPTTSSRR